MNQFIDVQCNIAAHQSAKLADEAAVDAFFESACKSVTQSDTEAIESFFDTQCTDIVRELSENDQAPEVTPETLVVDKKYTLSQEPKKPRAITHHEFAGKASGLLEKLLQNLLIYDPSAEEIGSFVQDVLLEKSLDRYPLSKRLAQASQNKSTDPATLMTVSSRQVCSKEWHSFDLLQSCSCFGFYVKILMKVLDNITLTIMEQRPTKVRFIHFSSNSMYST